MHDAGAVYGEALYGLAAEEGLSDRILEDLTLVCRVAGENPDYLRMLSEQSIPKEDRRALLDEAWSGQLHAYTLNFLKLLCDNGYITKLPGCEKEYRRRYNRDHGILQVRAVCASELSAAQRDKLLEALRARTGKTVELTVSVDPTLLGGMRLDMEGTRLDGSVRHHLDALQKLLQSSSM